MQYPHVTNPGTIRVFTQRAELRRWQKSPRFKAMKRDRALIPGAVCAHCFRHHGDIRYDRDGFMKTYDKGKKRGQPILVSLTINHMSEMLYLTEDLYLTWDEVFMEVCCTVCNGWDRKGKKVCPVCKCNPIDKDEPTQMCVSCFLDAHPDIKKEVEEKREARIEGKRQFNKRIATRNRAAKRKHPCKFWHINQRCGRGGACEHSPTKAEKNCKRGFEKKKGRIK